jgi:ribulose-phosphate 3-epimerase
MSVFPGFGGQAFIESTYDRVAQLKTEMVKQGVDVKIEVDGGVSVSNAQKLIQNGADILVSGSALFKAPNFNDYIHQMIA